MNTQRPTQAELEALAERMLEQVRQLPESEPADVIAASDKVTEGRLSEITGFSAGQLENMRRSGEAQEGTHYTTREKGRSRIIWSISAFNELIWPHHERAVQDTQVSRFTGTESASRSTGRARNVGSPRTSRLLKPV